MPAARKKSKSSKSSATINNKNSIFYRHTGLLKGGKYSRAHLAAIVAAVTLIGLFVILYLRANSLIVEAETLTGVGASHNSTESLKLNPTQDSWVNSVDKTKNYGSSSTMVSDGKPVEIAYMRYDLTSTAGKTITGAKMRMRVANPSRSIHNIKEVSNNTWGEGGITFNNRPIPGNVISTFNGGASGAWVEVDVTPYVKLKAGQLVSIAIDTPEGDGLDLYTRESAYKPELILTVTASSVSGAPSVISDSSASAGHALKYYNAGSAYKQVDTPAFTKMVVTAKGEQCNGAPIMSVKLNRTEVINSNVPNTGYTQFSANINMAAASYSLDISFSNDAYVAGVCDRNLIVDKIEFLGDSASPVPAALSATPGDQKVLLDWTEATDDVGVVHYEVWRDTTYVTKLAATTRSYTVTGLANGTTYSFRVVAYDATGKYANSNTVSATPTGGLVPPPAPTTSSGTGITGTAYYMDCNGDDYKDGKSTSTAWKSLTKVNSAPLAAGDGILFKRGCVWNQSGNWSGSLQVKWSGIVIGAYGDGNKPKFATASTGGVLVKVTGSSNTISDIEVQGPNGRGANYNIYGIELASGAKSNTVKNSYITGASAGVFIRAGSSYNKIGPANQFVKNQMINDPGGSNDDSGAFGINLHGNNNEIYQNYFEGQNAYSPDYGYDGASVEIYTSCNAQPASYNNIHHNIAVNDNAFTETGRTEGCTTVPIGNVYAYNTYTASGIANAIFINNRGRGGAGGFGGIDDTRVYNNTTNITGSNSSPVICSGCSYSSFTYRNNLIAAPRNISISGVDPAKVSNNIYATSPSGLFGSDFRLVSGSAAIDKGSFDNGGYKTDLAGKPIPFNSIIDIGAYEFGY